MVLQAGQLRELGGPDGLDLRIQPGCRDNGTGHSILVLIEERDIL